nr:hypothetical protein [Bacillus safensis]WEZ16816.1 hypothetical protein P5638_03775 [Bacillus safensis]
MTNKSDIFKLTDEDYKEISSKSYAIKNFKDFKEIEISNGRNMYVVDYKETKKGLNALTLVSREDYRISNKGKDLTKIKNAVIAYRGSEPIGAGQYKDTIKKHGKKRVR